MSDPALSDMKEQFPHTHASAESELEQVGEVADLADQTLTPEQNKRLLRKTNAVVLTVMIFASLLAFLDKNAMSFAAVYGMTAETHLQNQEYSWLGSIFYFGYLAMEVPSLWLLTRVPIGKFIAIVLVLWGIALCAMAGCYNFAGLAVGRFFLGILEAALLPCCILLTSIWYRREEHALVSALYFNTFAGIFGGILAYAIGHIEGGLSSWKYLFLIYGAVTILFGVVVFLILPDSPTKAWFFTAEEKKLVVLRTAENQTGMHTNKAWKLSQVTEALKDPKYWVLAVSVVAFAITNAGITNFNPLIISGYGFSQTKTVLMASPQAAVAIVAQVTATIIMLYVRNVRCIIWAVSTFPAIAGTVMIRTLDINEYRTASLTGVYLMGFYNVSFVTMLSLQSSNNSGTTKKSFASVSVAVFYSIGNIIGPQFFRTDQAPHYPLGIGAMMTAFAINGVMGIVYLCLCIFENKRRDRIHGKPTESAITVGLEVEMEDTTDGNNPDFRYTY
ncbi:putative allantoate permease [Thozetella sp. PMI_491]|nr:putative allantoate permease [Thozetella sp. PMI_491]